MSSTDLKHLLKSADELRKKGKINEAIALYKQVKELGCDYPVKVDINLGDMLLHHGNIDEAIELYQRLIKNDKDIRVGLCMKVGDTLFEKGRWKESLIFYQKISDKNLRRTPWIKVRNALLRVQDEEKAYESYLNYIQKYYVVNHLNKVVYCAIPKNGCTFFKSVMLEYMDSIDNYNELGDHIHSYICNNFTLGCREDEHSLKDIYKENDYFCFTILRNPLSRLVSGYLSKFMSKHPSERYQKVIDEVYQSEGLSDNTKQSITFSQFVHHLTRTEDYNLDPHWRPQHTFLGEDKIKFDFIGRLEDMETVAQVLSKKTNIDISGKLERNKTDYKNFALEEKFHDYYPYQLRKLEQFPKTSHFYTPELEAIVRVRYAKDIEMYERQFQVPVSL